MKKFMQILSMAILALSVSNVVNAKTVTKEVFDETLTLSELRSILERDNLLKFRSQTGELLIFSTGDHEIWKELDVNLPKLGVSLDLKPKIVFIGDLPQKVCNEKAIIGWNSILFDVHIAKKDKVCNLVQAINLMGGVTEDNIKSTIVIFAGLVKTISR